METTIKTKKSSFKRFRNIILVLAGMATGFSFCHLFSSVHRNHTGGGIAAVTVPVAKHPVVLQREVTASQKVTDRQLALAEQKSTQLKQQLQQARAALKNAKEKNYRLQVQLYQAFEQVDNSQADSTGTLLLPPPDNVLAMLDTLAFATVQKDSLYESIAQNMQLQLDNKDSVIAVQNGHTSLLKQDFELSIASQQLLRDENHRLEKKVKQQRFTGRLKSAGLLILSGLALKSIIH